MQTYTNVSGVPLSIAAYLAADFYDYIPNTISATRLLKPVRQLVLGARVPAELAQVDILSRVKSRIGTSIHDGVERVWKGGHYKQAMRLLGYPEHVIERIAVNPEDHELSPEMIPVYMEQRMFREFMGQRISGKFDFLAEGRLEDIKSTSTFTWIFQTKVEDHQLQGSIYRWLDAGQPVPKITQDHMVTQFFFTDWMAGKAKKDKNYPQRQVENQHIPLLSLDDTQDFIAGKLSEINRLRDTDEVSLPRCSDKELWRKESVFKYYKNPDKRDRSTRTCDTAAEAYAYMQNEGKGVGIVVEIPGEVIACKYCSAFPICSQKDDLIADGSLKIDAEDY